MFKYFSPDVRELPEQILTRRARIKKTISEGRSDAQEIMWTLRIVQVLVWVLLCVRRERKNVPTISECIPHNKGQPRDARSEVRVNQWVYMHTAALILVCITARVMLMILGIHFHPRA